jgi:putative ABC transport system substrate-binding protein
VDRRAFLSAITLSLLGEPLAARAQTAGKVWRVGALGFGVPASPEEIAKQPFWVAMKELGWIEGQTMVVEQRYGKSGDQLDAAAAELVRLKVDIIVAFTGTQAGAARKATQTIPIVMTASGDAVRQGLVASLAQPGGNVTGLTAISPDLSRKRLELLREAVPKLSRVGVLSCGEGPLTRQQWAETRAAAQVHGIQLVPLEVLGCAGSQSQLECLGAIPTAFAQATRQRVQAIIEFDCAQFNTTAVVARTTDLSTKNGLPGMYPASFYARAGGFMSYAADLSDLSRRGATYVDRILKGAKPADLPVEQPTKFDLVINLKTAKALGLTIPPSLLQRADQVIE